MKGSKKLFIFSILCIVAGLILTVFSGVRDGGYLKQLLGEAGAARLQEKKTVDVTEDFHSLQISEFSADLQLLPSGDGSCRVVFGEYEYSRCKVGVKNGTLTVTREAENRPRSGLTVYTDILPVCVYLPEGSYRELSVSSTSGSVRSSGDFSWESAAIKTGSGDVRLEALSAGELTLECTSGDVRLDQLDTGSLSVQTGSGDIKLQNCSVSALKLKSTCGKLEAEAVVCSGDGDFSSGSGDIELEDASFRALRVSATSGDVTLERTVCSAEVQVETGSGDIRLRGAEAGSFQLSSTSGDVKGSVRGSVDFDVETTSGSVRTRGGVRGGAECRVKTGSGDVDLDADR